jgi:hypothetical protein
VISAADVGAIGQLDRGAVIALMDNNRESLAGVTGESMADEVMAHGKDWSFKTLAPQLIHRKRLVLYSNDFFKPGSLELIKDVKAAGGTMISEKYVVTDHGWSDHRIALADDPKSRVLPSRVQCYRLAAQPPMALPRTFKARSSPASSAAPNPNTRPDGAGRSKAKRASE